MRPKSPNPLCLRFQIKYPKLNKQCDRSKLWLKRSLNTFLESKSIFFQKRFVSTTSIKVELSLKKILKNVCLCAIFYFLIDCSKKYLSLLMLSQHLKRSWLILISSLKVWINWLSFWNQSNKILNCKWIKTLNLNKICTQLDFCLIQNKLLIIRNQV